MTDKTKIPTPTPEQKEKLRVWMKSGEGKKAIEDSLEKARQHVKDFQEKTKFDPELLKRTFR